MTRTLKGFLNLDYIEVRNTPFTESVRFGRGTDASTLKIIEGLVARAILTQRVPIRGAEVLFFRTVLGLSQRALGSKLGYSDVAILKWERSHSKRLEPVNEVAVRALMAGYFGVKLLGTFEALLGVEQAPKKLILDYRTRTERRQKTDPKAA